MQEAGWWWSGVKSDAQLRVMAINRREGDRSVAAVIIQEIKKLMAQDFQECLIRFENRLCNGVAHSIA
jgi:hypothetical protein